jgi:hypothetical protein
MKCLCEPILEALPTVSLRPTKTARKRPWRKNPGMHGTIQMWGKVSNSETMAREQNEMI